MVRPILCDICNSKLNDDEIFILDNLAKNRILNRTTKLNVCEKCDNEWDKNLLKIFKSWQLQIKKEMKK